MASAPKKWRVAKRISVTDKWFYYEVAGLDQGMAVMAALARYDDACERTPTQGKVQAFSERTGRWTDATG